MENPSTAEPPKTPMFTNNTFVYRIPALIYIKDDLTFLAFAEKRTSPKDEDATLLVIRRGKQENGSIQWSDVQELKSARLPEYRTMNPCPVYDKITKTIFLFFNCVYGKVREQTQINNGKNEAKLCYVTSTDFGVTWTDTTDLTEIVIGPKIEQWATFSVGPGHGIQTNKSRLIIPAYFYPVPEKKPYAFAFYSDDHGATWDVGHHLGIESSECEMAEIRDKNGKEYLYCNARSPTQHNGHRVEARSDNGAVDFSKLPDSQKLVEPKTGCQGSVVSFDHGDEETWLLFSHTTDCEYRKDLGVYLNKTPYKADSWDTAYIINSGVSGYSDLTQCDNEQFACLLECGTGIVFVKFPLNDIRPGPDPTLSRFCCSLV